MDELAKYLSKKHDELKGKRVNWDPHWQEVADFVTPRKKNVFTHRTQPGGEKRHERVYDSTAIHANSLLGSALQGMLTNPATQWFELATGIPKLDGKKHIREYLQLSSRIMSSIMNKSNFQTEIHEMYHDLGSLGTAALRIEEDEKDIVRYHCRPIYEHWIDEDFRGEVDTITRELKKNSRQIRQEFDLKKEAQRLPEGERNKVDKFNADDLQEWNVIHYICPRKDIDEKYIKQVGKRFTYISAYLVEELGIVLGVKGFLENPYVISRWTKTSGEIYGRSPSMNALADIKMINEMMRTQIRAAQKVADPVLQAPDDGMLLPIKTIPGGVNYYRAGTPDRIFPLETGANLGINQEMMEDVRRRIREAFFIDQLQLLEGPQMTATEVLQRTEERLRLMGPILGQQEHELLRPLINRTFSIISRAGVLPENPPEELRDIDLQVRFSSMIARAQRASEADNITRIFQVAAPIVQAQPQTLDLISGDGMLKYLFDIFNGPQEILNKEEDVEQVRGQRAEMEQQQMQLEQQKMQSESARNVGVKVQQ